MNWIKSFCLLLLTLLISGVIWAENPKPIPLSEAHKKWLDEVYWIVSDYEKNAFIGLKSESSRERFIEAFWENRDPTPGTKANEYKEEHYKRFEYANKQFGRETPLPGWKTDRGRVYILLGKPRFTKKSVNPFDMVPMELWHYVGLESYGLPGSIYLMFFHENGVAPYRLYSPLQDGIQELFGPQSANQMKTDEELFEKLRTEVDPEIAHASLSSIPTEGGDPRMDTGSLTAEMVQAKIQNARNYDIAKRKYVEDFIKDRPSVQVYTSIDTGGIRDGIYWFQAPSGIFYIDYAVEFEPDKLDMGLFDEYYTSLSTDGSISTPEKVQVDQIIGNHEIKLNEKQFQQIKSLPFQYQGRKPIVPGKFSTTLIMNNNVSRRSITFVRDIDIPDVSKITAPYITPLLPIRAVEKAPEDTKKVRPFQFADKILIPNLPAKYAQKGNMQVYHQVLFPQNFNADAGNLIASYTVRTGDQVQLEVTEPISIAGSELSGNSIELRKDIPLGGLSLGSKTLVVELKQNQNVLARSTPLPFSVEPEVNSGYWKFAVSIPDYGSPYHSQTLAQQLVRLNRTKQALGLLESEFKQNPESIEIRLQLMRIGLKANEYTKVIELGSPLEVKNPRNTELLWLMGWAYYGLGKYEDAVRFFERYRLENPKRVEMLNILADIYYRLNQPEKSLERLQQSLALKPDQKDILELKKKIESNR